MTPAGSRLVRSGAAPAWRGRSSVEAPVRRSFARGKAVRWGLLLVAVWNLAGAGVSWATPPARTAPEHAVKAEFIERFTRFIDWPDSAFATPRAPFVVCAWGHSPLASHLEQVVTRRPIKARPVHFLHVESPGELQPCHVLYVATSDRVAVRSIVARTRGKPLMSVGDQPGLGEEGLVINLFRDAEGFVRFEINLEAARRSGLKISAKLMRLARQVGTRK